MIKLIASMLITIGMATIAAGTVWILPGTPLMYDTILILASIWLVGTLIVMKIDLENSL